MVTRWSARVTRFASSSRPRPMATRTRRLGCSDDAGACIALVAQDIFSMAEFLDRNVVAPIKPERDDDEDLLRRIQAHNQNRIGCGATVFGSKKYWAWKMR